VRPVTPLKSIKEYSSLRVGTRQSVYPPVVTDDALATASAQVALTRPPGVFCHMRPVTRSLTVPSPLFWYCAPVPSCWASWPLNGWPAVEQVISVPWSS